MRNQVCRRQGLHDHRFGSQVSLCNQLKDLVQVPRVVPSSQQFKKFSPMFVLSHPPLDATETNPLTEIFLVVRVARKEEHAFIRVSRVPLNVHAMQRHDLDVLD